MIFFAGTNDLRRCKQIAGTWNIKVGGGAAGTGGREGGTVWGPASGADTRLHTAGQQAAFYLRR